MKKLLVIVLALVTVLPAVARERKYADIPFRHEVRLGWGGYPNTSILPYNCCCCDAEPYYHHKSFADLYKGYSGSVYMTGAIAAEYTYHFKKWCSFGGVFSYNGIFADNYDRLSSEKLGRDHGVSMALLPYVRFNYLSKPYVKLYSSVGLGVGYSAFRGERELLPAFQTSFFGVSFGREFFGYCELGIGYLYKGCMVGIGYRF